MKSLELFDKPTNRKKMVYLNDDGECPLCKKSIIPEHLYGITYVLNDCYVCSLLERCPSCNHTFMNVYELDGNTCEELICSEPNAFKKIKFDKNIVKISAMFEKIYNQAYQAETLTLDQIAGIGYRKAVEFLIKDYLISVHPEKEKTIKETPLGRCIDNYIDNPIIKELAQKTVWLGNDETHYIRKHTDRDIEDLKRFIQATVYYINMELIANDASTITHA